jgi:hypothetical protein
MSELSVATCGSLFLSDKTDPNHLNVNGNGVLRTEVESAGDSRVIIRQAHASLNLLAHPHPFLPPPNGPPLVLLFRVSASGFSSSSSSFLFSLAAQPFDLRRLARGNLRGSFSRRVTKATFARPHLFAQLLEATFELSQPKIKMHSLRRNLQRDASTRLLCTHEPCLQQLSDKLRRSRETSLATTSQDPRAPPSCNHSLDPDRSPSLHEGDALPCLLKIRVPFLPYMLRYSAEARSETEHVMHCTWLRYIMAQASCCNLHHQNCRSRQRGPA